MDKEYLKIQMSKALASLNAYPVSAQIANDRYFKGCKLTLDFLKRAQSAVARGTFSKERWLRRFEDELSFDQYAANIFRSIQDIILPTI